MACFCSCYRIADNKPMHARNEYFISISRTMFIMCTYTWYRSMYFCTHPITLYNKSLLEFVVPFTQFYFKAFKIVCYIITTNHTSCFFLNIITSIAYDTNYPTQQESFLNTASLSTLSLITLYARNGIWQNYYAKTFWLLVENHFCSLSCDAEIQTTCKDKCIFSTNTHNSNTKTYNVIWRILTLELSFLLLLYICVIF